MTASRVYLPLCLLLASVCAAGPAHANGHWPALWRFYEAGEAALPASRWTFESFLSRLAALEAAEDKVALVDRFFRAQRRFPMTEEDGSLHFVFRGEASDVSMEGPLTAERGAPDPLDPVEETDLFYRSYQVDPSGAWRYRFVVDGAPAVDERNPRRVPGEEEWSEVVMPEWRDPSYLQTPRAAVHRGYWWTLPVESATLGLREIEIYLPADYYGPLPDPDEEEEKKRRRRKKPDGEEEGEEGEAGEKGKKGEELEEEEAEAEPEVEKGWDKRYPLLLVAGAARWRELGRLENTLDNLFHLRVQPAVVALLPEREATEGSAAIGLEEYARFAATELVPAVQARYRLADGPAETAIVGAGPGAAAALFVGLRYPEVVGGLGGLSPQPEPALDDVLAAASGDQRAYLSWSRLEGAAEGVEGDPAAAAEQLFAELQGAGVRIEGGARAAGPGWTLWRAESVDLFRQLLPRPPPLPEILARTAFKGARATLAVSVDAPAEVTVGTEEPVELAPEEIHEVEVDVGNVYVRARSLDVERAVWWESIEVLDPNSTVEVAVELAAVVRGLRRTERREGVFRDTDELLMWRRQDNGRDVRWEEAEEFCRETPYAGYFDWRLPTLDELDTLQAMWSRAAYKTIGRLRLSGCCPWSSELSGETAAWSFNFRFRRRLASPLTYSMEQRALCVRSYDPETE